MNDRYNITLNIRFFAGLRERMGNDSLSVSLPADTRAKDLAAIMKSQYPEMKILLKNARIALNSEFIDGNTMLHNGDEIAFIPPVSGG